MALLTHPEGTVGVAPTRSGKASVSVTLSDPGAYMVLGSCETAYPLPLIEKILAIKGPANLCDALVRDEDPRELLHIFRYDLLGYVSEQEFAGKRILDFGCGSGASTMVLARLFPKAQIVGIDLVENLVSIAELRASHYGFDTVRFLCSPDGCSFPKDVGGFDYIILSAVYEHLLPEERRVLLPQVWQHLALQGVLFIGLTPDRHFPVEGHTTGLPFINYLPDVLTLYFARWFSRRVQSKETWESLLRRGIRGGTAKEIMKILGETPHRPVLLKPRREGLNDRLDLWFAISLPAGRVWLKRLALFCFKALKRLTGLTLTPNLSLAIRKEGRL